MKLGLLAGNRQLPLIFSQRAKAEHKDLEIVAICFKGETSPALRRFVDRTYWIEVGRLKEVIEVLRSEGITYCVMVGQINPQRVFEAKGWDEQMRQVVYTIDDLRPHSIFSKIIERLESEGIKFLPSTMYIEQTLASRSLMNNVAMSEGLKRTIRFGLGIMYRYRNLDIGQTIVVKDKAVVACEALEGTDNTILRGYRLAGEGCVVLKFSKQNQDLRFDVPVVGLTTLKFLRKIKASALVLEAKKVIIIQKDRFLNLSSRYRIPVIGVGNG